MSIYQSPFSEIEQKILRCLYAVRQSTLKTECMMYFVTTSNEYKNLITLNIITNIKNTLLRVNWDEVIIRDPDLYEEFRVTEQLGLFQMLYKFNIPNILEWSNNR